MSIRTKKNLSKIIASPDKEITKTAGAGGVLSRLWRQMLMDMGIGPVHYDMLLQRYVTDPRNGIPNNRKDQTSARGNIVKELAKPHMTWKVFCKGLRYLSIVKFELIIKAYHYDGRTSSHKTQIGLGAVQDIKEEHELVQEIGFLDEKIDPVNKTNDDYGD